MRKRKRSVLLRLNEMEFHKLESLCAVSGLKREQALRQLIMGMQIKPRPPDSYTALARELSAIGNNLNQIAHVANATGQIKQNQLTQAQELLIKTWTLVQERM